MSDRLRPDEIEARAARAMLAALKNTRAYLAKHADKLPPMSLNGMDIAIAAAEAAGITTEAS